MKRIQRGPVRGISLKLQEEERERRMDFIPEKVRIAGGRIRFSRILGTALRSFLCASFPFSLHPVPLVLHPCTFCISTPSPLQSAIDTDKIAIDADTKEMLKAIDFGSLANVEVVALPVNGGFERRERREKA
jgi:hypothetical protein